MDATFDDALNTAAMVEGWLTDAQAWRLWNAARQVAPDGRIVEIGSFRGRSTVVLASAAAEGVELIAIDPHAGTDRGPQEFVGYEAEAAEDHEVFHHNLDRAGVADRVMHLREFSGDAHPLLEGSADLLYIDGAHRFGPARDDIVRWGARVRPGGTMLIHDSFSSVGVTAAIAASLLTGRRFRYLGRSGSLAQYRAEPDGLSGLARVSNAIRQLTALPWFVRNVVIKALIVARLGPLARILGHRQQNWPY